jgi:hypothetical protein
MPIGKNRVDNIHDQMPSVFNTRVNPTWKALIEAIGEVDQDTMDLIEAVRDQFFVKTAKRPYLDRIGTANLVQRPRFIGMDDPTFRKFIPVVAYNPKQVKLIFDELLDIFFFKDATTSFAQTMLHEPFTIKDGWELEYEIDSYIKERIQFKEEEFSDISNATASEIVSAINRQTSNSYAIAFEDGISKEVTIRIFTNTVGSKGSVTITGGRANIGLQFDGYNTEAGSGVATEWAVTKSGDIATMTFTGSGGSPKLDTVSAGDIVIIDRGDQGVCSLPSFGTQYDCISSGGVWGSNTGSFIIQEVDVVNNIIKFKNLFAVPETFTISYGYDVKFLALVKNNVYLKDRRAVVWQVSPGEVIVEMPPSPPVVKRNRKGAAHINGITTAVTSFDRALSTMTLSNAADFPADGGQFYFIPENQIKTFFPVEGDTVSFNYNSRLVSDMPIYTYVSKVAGIAENEFIIQGVSPTLPLESSLNQFTLVSADRDSSNIITAITTAPHNYEVGNSIIITDATLGAGSGPDVNGAWRVTEIVDSTTFKMYSFGGSLGSRASTGGFTRAERPASSTTGGLVIMRSAQMDPRKVGPYLWSQDSDFVLSSLTTNLTIGIGAGLTKKNIQVEPNDIPNAEGQLIFDFGTSRQEGPVRYFFKPSSTTLAIDPSYVFNYDHSYGSSVTMIRRRGSIKFQGFGTERAPYITDPAAAREVLKELMQRVKSVGIFLNFIIRYPTQYYSTIDVYSSGIDPG